MFPFSFKGSVSSPHLHLLKKSEEKQTLYSYGWNFASYPCSPQMDLQINLTKADPSITSFFL